MVRDLLKQKFFPLILFDALGVFSAFFIALMFRFDNQIPAVSIEFFIKVCPFIVLLYLLTNLYFNLYGHIWRYTSAQEVVTIAGSATLSTIVLLAFVIFRDVSRPLPIGVVVAGGVLSLVSFVTLRYRQRLLTSLMGRLQRLVGSPDRQRILIIGAGEAGQALARQLTDSHYRHRYELVGFVDDNPQKLGLRVHGAPILGDCQAIPQVVAGRTVSLIVIAIHKIPGEALREILSLCLSTPARVKILPDFVDDIGSTAGALPLKDIMPEDLLGRHLHQIDQTACQKLIEGKVVLVTGAAGSIGSELSRQILDFGPRSLILLDNNETGLHDLALTLRTCQSPASVVQHEPSENIVPIIADVTRRARMEHVFETYHPQIIFHAAAYKHVPLMEEHPGEAVLVNISGTRTLIQLAAHYHSERFVLISSDKAVNPTSVMGMTKRVAELMLLNQSQQQSLNGRRNGKQPTLFTAVRFGNVLGSRGSVAPVFTRQIDLGGPVTVTHPEMTRYFMSIPEAVSLVIQAAALTEGYDLFMLNMGQKIRIADLAQKMIRLRGLRPNEDIKIIYTGVRPGEKLHEELLAPHEDRAPTSHPGIFRVLSAYPGGGVALEQAITALLALAAEERVADLKKGLAELTSATLNNLATTHGNLEWEQQREPQWN
jgi:FlaA1/EpsC-like NDP-sugar epimerase